jgi:hypothetical protein
MPARPNFTELRLDSGTLLAKGNSVEPLPDEIRVYIEQGNEPAKCVFGSVDELNTAWVAELPAAGFSTGPAMASGVEIRTDPFTATTWTEQVEIQ